DVLIHGPLHGLRQTAGRREEGQAGYEPLERVVHLVSIEDLGDRLLQALDRLLRRKADVEAGLELAWDDVRCAGARADVGDLERRRLEELVALVPGAARELCERRRDGVHGIVRKVRIGDVTLYTVYGE